jgi:hypothetical protein
MPALARAQLESLLRARHLDRTLTSTLPASTHDDLMAATELARVDAALGGGFPRGQLSEVVGTRSSGRTSLLLQLLGAETARGELVALVDALDMLDVASAAAAGLDLERFLWIRGHVVPNPGMCRDMNQRAIEQAIKALTLILQAGKFGIVALDIAEAPADAIRRLPFTTWLRLQHIIEGTRTACVLMGSDPIARSTAGLTVRLSRPGSLDPPTPSAPSCRFDDGLFEGLDVELKVIRARAHRQDEATVGWTTRADAHV